MTSWMDRDCVNLFWKVLPEFNCVGHIVPNTNSSVVWWGCNQGLADGTWQTGYSTRMKTAGKIVALSDLLTSSLKSGVSWLRPYAKSPTWISAVVSVPVYNCLLSVPAIKSSSEGVAVKWTISSAFAVSSDVIWVRCLFARFQVP